MSNRFRVLGLCVLIGSFGLLSSFSGCGTTIGNGLVNVKFGDFDASRDLRRFTPDVFTRSLQDFRPVSTFILCLEKIEFKQNGTGISKEAPLHVTVTPELTFLKLRGIPPTEYSSVYLHLRPDVSGCTENASATVTTGSTYSVTEPTFSYYVGSIKIGEGSIPLPTTTTVVLDVQPIVTVLGTAVSSGEVKKILETTPGNVNATSSPNGGSNEKSELYAMNVRMLAAEFGLPNQYGTDLCLTSMTFFRESGSSQSNPVIPFPSAQEAHLTEAKSFGTFNIPAGGYTKIRIHIKHELPCPGLGHSVTVHENNGDYFFSGQTYMDFGGNFSAEPGGVVLDPQNIQSAVEGIFSNEMIPQQFESALGVLTVE